MTKNHFSDKMKSVQGESTRGAAGYKCLSPPAPSLPRLMTLHGPQNVNKASIPASMPGKAKQTALTLGRETYIKCLSNISV